MDSSIEPALGGEEAVVEILPGGGGVVDRWIPHLPPAVRASLAARSAEVCVTFTDHRLPPGTYPVAGRIGVENTEQGLHLFVDRSHTYVGDDAEVAEWLQRGERVFPDLNAALAWLEDVAPASNVSTSDPIHSGAQARPSSSAPSEVTSLSNVPVEGECVRRVSEIDFRNQLLARVAGQDYAVSRLGARVARHVNKPFPRRPDSTVLIGKTAVGKTTAAETIPEALTSLTRKEWEFIRLDMGEFSEKHSVARLIGTPPGYIGYGDECLASRLARNGDVVVLFDEIEKAHPAVLFTIMNLLDKGRLDTERYGRVRATKAVLLFTSNLGADEIGGDVRDDLEGRSHLLRHGLAPELVGRFSEIVTFTELSPEALVEVTTRSVMTVAADYGVRVEWIAPEYLGDVLRRMRGNRLGVRAIEYLVDADLGEQFADFDAERAQIYYQGAGVVCAITDPHERDRDPEVGGDGS